MATAQVKHHDYHLVDPSPWPIVGAVSAFIMAVGAILWMHHLSQAAPIIFGIGTIGVLYTMASWWADVIREAQYKGDHTRVVQISHRYGMILFIASEVMFFVAWFWAFFNSALFPADAVHATRDAVFGCGAGTAMGACSVQAYEYAHAAFSFGGNVYGATFFMATGFHGFHVLVGTIFLLVCLFRAYAGHFTPTQHLGFEFAAWYWHFVDVVWLFLFICIYVWGHGAETMAHGAH